MKKIQITKLCVSPLSKNLLFFGLPLALVQLFFSVLELYHGNYPSSLYASRLFHILVEYVLLDILLLIFGAFLFDIAEKDRH